jgi:hypothetical protein
MPASPKNPFSHFIRGVEADVLLTMWWNPLYESATTIARDSGRSRSEVRVVLNYLVSTGLVTVLHQGGRRWFHLNRDHPLHPILMSMSKIDRNQLVTTHNAFV